MEKASKLVTRTALRTGRGPQCGNEHYNLTNAIHQFTDGNGAPEGLQGTGRTINICDSHSELAKGSALLGCYTTSTGKPLQTFRRKCLHLQGQAVLFFITCFTLKINHYFRNIQFTHNFPDALFSIILLFMGSSSTLTIRASIQ